jgi:SAM-dependent methyltransferase
MDRLNSLWSGYQSLFLSAWYPTFYFTRHAPDAAISGRRPRLLDIGCGSGDKLRYIRRRSGWETYGVDFNTQAVDNARASGAGDVRLTDGERLPFEDDFFDAVYSWHSLEHHYSPSTTMAECSRVLRPGGYGVLAIPSGDSLGLRLLRGYWGPLEAPRHLYHFTKETLTRLIEHVGLKAHRAFYDFSFYGLFVDQEILESLEFAMQDTSSPVVALPRGLLKTLRVGGLLSSAATLPILPFNQRLGRLWRGTNLVLHFSKPANP